LNYVGHTGTGFNERELTRLMKLMKPLERTTSPFAEKPRTNERPHWIHPKLVAQIKFTEWTADGRLRHPVYLGLRDDKKPEEVVREPTSRLHREIRPARQTTPPTTVTHANASGDVAALIDQLRTMEDGPGGGPIELADGRLEVTNLRKLFWPKLKLTKGDLFRYYLQASPYLLPAIEGRPHRGRSTCRSTRTRRSPAPRPGSGSAPPVRPTRRRIPRRGSRLCRGPRPARERFGGSLDHHLAL
jgi:bifunctional non-homologous end joining protein LigD